MGVYNCGRCDEPFPLQPPFDDDECHNCGAPGSEALDESEQRDLRYEAHYRLAGG